MRRIVSLGLKIKAAWCCVEYFQMNVSYHFCLVTIVFVMLIVVNNGSIRKTVDFPIS